MLQPIEFIDPRLEPKKYPLPLHSITAAKLFADTVMDRIKYIEDMNKFLYYDGIKWLTDTSQTYTNVIARDFALKMNELAEDSPDDSNFWKFAKSLLSPGKRGTLIKESRLYNYAKRSDLNKHEHLFNCLNCTLDLNTLGRNEHDPADLITQVANVIYDANAKCVEWDNFIKDIMCGDTELIRYLQKALGYSLTADTRLECMFFLYGATTRNGKSTFMETILRLFSDYGKSMQPDSIAHRKRMDGSKASSDIARHSNVRLVNISEPPDEFKMDAARVKQMTGNDTITTRHLFQEFFEYIPRFKVFVNTNHLPTITDDTLFASGRIKVIPFLRHFAEHEQRKDLKQIFQKPENLSGIFNWVLNGLKLYKAEGLYEPQAVIKATEEYRKSADSANIFLETCTTTTDESDKIRQSEVYRRYSSWCSLHDMKEVPKSKFLSALNRKYKIKRDSKLGYYVSGIKLKEAV